MAFTRLTVTEMIPFFLHVIYESLENTEDPETKKELEKIFRLPGLRKFYLEHKQEFLQKYKIFINSISNLQQTRIEIINDTGEQIPDEKPSILKGVLKIIKRLTGLKTESEQLNYLLDLMVEVERQELNESLAEKYLT